MTLSPRLTLQIDAVVSGALGLLLVVLGGPVSDWLDLPVNLLRGAGLFAVGWAALLAWIASRPPVHRTVLAGIAVGNTVWVIASFGLLVSGLVEPNGWGVAFLTFQALVVAGFVWAQFMALPQTVKQEPAI
jgi:hypothetical protein